MASLTIDGNKSSEVTTIDNLDLKIHEQYARNQEVHDPSFVRDSATIPQHSETLGISAIYTPQWDVLFEAVFTNLPWALFVPPRNDRRLSRRIFTHRIVMSIEGSSEEAEEGLLFDIPTAEISLQYEEERSALVNLHEVVGKLNKLLDFIRSKQLQYQKG